MLRDARIAVIVEVGTPVMFGVPARIAKLSAAPSGTVRDAAAAPSASVRRIPAVRSAGQPLRTWDGTGNASRRLVVRSSTAADWSLRMRLAVAVPLGLHDGEQ